MAETYALHEGAFGRAVVLELRDDLVAHAHGETQLAFWLGGARVEANVGSQVVKYGEQLALGTIGTHGDEKKKARPLAARRSSSQGLAM